MSRTEELRVTIFLSVIATIYLLAFFSLIRIALIRLGKLAPPQNPIRRWGQRISLLLAGLFTLSIIYGFTIEPYWLSVSRIKIKSKKIAKGSAPIKVALFSDLHSDAKKRLEDRLIDKIKEEKPDIILFTGDTINSLGGLKHAKGCFTSLSALAPTYVIKGNWDVWYWYQDDLFGNTNVKELKGAGEKVEIRGNSLWLTGIPVGSEERLKKAVTEIPPDIFSIFLFHYPDLINDVNKEGGVDLYCAGHTHGGQIALPLYGALMTLSKFDKKYEAGLYQVDKTRLYVNRGIGMEGGDSPRVRFWAWPELTIFEISPET